MVSRTQGRDGRQQGYRRNAHGASASVSPVPRAKSSSGADFSLDNDSGRCLATRATSSWCRASATGWGLTLSATEPAEPVAAPRRRGAALDSIDMRAWCSLSQRRDCTLHTPSAGDPRLGSVDPLRLPPGCDPLRIPGLSLFLRLSFYASYPCCHYSCSVPPSAFLRTRGGGGLVYPRSSFLSLDSLLERRAPTSRGRHPHPEDAGHPLPADSPGPHLTHYLYISE